MKLQTRYLFLAALAHLLLIVCLVAVVDLSHRKLGSGDKQESIEMRLADKAVVTTTERRRQAEIARQKALAEQQRQEALAKKQAEDKRRKEEARKKAEAEKQQKAEAEKRRQAEEARKQAEAEKKRKAEEARKQAEAEKKRKAEEARKQAEAEKKRQEEERRRQQEAAERQALQNALQSEMAAEQEAREVGEAQSRYAVILKRHIENYWQRPPSGPEDFSCELKVTQMASGDVIDVELTQSCGSVPLDESVKKAVLRSSPLPRPEDPRAFVKTLILEFKPR